MYGAAACLFIALALAAFAAAQLLHSARLATDALPAEMRATRGALIEQVQAARIDAFAEIDTQATALQTRAERQIAAARKDAIAEVQALHSDALQAAGLALYEVDLARVNADDQLSATNYLLAHGIGAVMATSNHANSLMDAYAALPDRVATSPAWLALEPEFTCSKDGAGYGGCWHSRVTALLGEAARAGGVFAQRFPEFSSSVTGIAHDVHVFTSRAVAPRGFWGTFKDVVTSGSGVARAGAAAGLFDARVAPNPFASGSRQ